MTRFLLLGCLAFLGRSPGPQAIPPPVQAERNFLEDAVALGLAHVASGRSAERDAETSDPIVRAQESAAQARLDRIQEELDRADLPEWAGVYRYGDGFGVNVALWVAPRAGAMYTWHGCLGLYDVNHGEIVQSSEDGLRVDLAVDPVHNLREHEAGLPRPILSDRWYFVAWSDEAYLIPSSRMIAFCNAVNAGAASRLGSFPCRGGDAWLWVRELPSGVPIVPPAFRPFLLAEPVEASLVAVEEPAQDGAYSDGTTKLCVLATADRGLRHGLLPGMILHTLGGRRIEGEIVRVEEESCAVEFRYPATLAKAPEVGARVGTRSPAAGR